MSTTLSKHERRKKIKAMMAKYATSQKEDLEKALSDKNIDPHQDNSSGDEDENQADLLCECGIKIENHQGGIECKNMLHPTDLHTATLKSQTRFIIPPIKNLAIANKVGLSNPEPSTRPRGISDSQRFRHRVSVHQNVPPPVINPKTPGGGGGYNTVFTIEARPLSHVSRVVLNSPTKQVTPSSFTCAIPQVNLETKDATPISLFLPTNQQPSNILNGSQTPPLLNNPQVCTNQQPHNILNVSQTSQLLNNPQVPIIHQEVHVPQDIPNHPPHQSISTIENKDPPSPKTHSTLPNPNIIHQPMHPHLPPRPQRTLPPLHSNVHTPSQLPAPKVVLSTLSPPHLVRQVNRP